MKNTTPPKDWFYSVEPNFKRVSEEELGAYIKSYPRKLEPDGYMVFEPPLVTWNDFELADKWPFSVVAKKWDDMCSIVENIEEVFASKTGRTAADWERESE